MSVSSQCILILSFNHPEITSRTIRSVINQTQLPVLLIHNGSELSHQLRLQNEFSNIEHIVIKKNIGFSGGANFGFQYAFKKYDQVIFLTNDCLAINLPENWSENTVLLPQILHKKSDKIDAVGGYFIPHKGIIHHCRTIEDFDQIIKSVSFDSSANLISKSRILPYAPAVSFGVSKKIFDTVGGFDERFGTYWEDVDWSQKVLKAGFDIQVNTNWQIRHMVGKTCHKNSLYSLYFFQRNRKKVSWKYCAIHLRPLLLINLFLLWTKSFIRLSLSRRFKDMKLLIQSITD